MDAAFPLYLMLGKRYRAQRAPFTPHLMLGEGTERTPSLARGASVALASSCDL